MHAVAPPQNQEKTRVSPTPARPDTALYRVMPQGRTTAVGSKRAMGNQAMLRVLGVRGDGATRPDPGRLPGPRGAEEKHSVSSAVDDQERGADRVNIAVGAGSYSPGTAGGDRLLAHELAHVVRQSNVVRRWPIGKPPDQPAQKTPDAPAQAPKADDRPLPATRDGKAWVKPEAARTYLPMDYDAVIDKKVNEIIDLKIYAASWLMIQRQFGIDLQKFAKGQLEHIRKNDIWPNWGTLNHALTFLGTWAGCLAGGCEIALVTGAISLYDTGAGAASSVAESCIPNPKSAGCAAAVANGVTSIVAARKNEKATVARLSDKEQAKAVLELGQKIEKGFDSALAELQEHIDQLDDQILFLRKAYDFARWGDVNDDPLVQKYKRGRAI